MGVIILWAMVCSFHALSLASSVQTTNSDNVVSQIDLGHYCITGQMLADHQLQCRSQTFPEQVWTGD